MAEQSRFYGLLIGIGRKQPQRLSAEKGLSATVRGWNLGAEIRMLPTSRPDRDVIELLINDGTQAAPFDPLTLGTVFLDADGLIRFRPSKWCLIQVEDAARSN